MDNFHYENENKLREIETARSVESINEFAKKGFFPLIKELEENPEIHSKFAVFQNRKTGEIVKTGDFRCRYRTEDDEMDLIIPYTSYYPYHHELPFAAYIIPPDLAIGEKVFLKDVIPDIVGSTWNQGDVFRLDHCEAIWNGTDFDLLFDEENDVLHFIG